MIFEETFYKRNSCGSLQPVSVFDDMNSANLGIEIAQIRKETDFLKQGNSLVRLNWRVPVNSLYFDFIPYSPRANAICVDGASLLSGYC